MPPKEVVAGQREHGWIWCTWYELVNRLGTEERATRLALSSDSRVTASDIEFYVQMPQVLVSDVEDHVNDD